MQTVFFLVSTNCVTRKLFPVNASLWHSLQLRLLRLSISWPTPDSQWRFTCSTRTSNGTARALGMSSSYFEKLKDMSVLVRAWQNIVHRGKEWQTTSVILPENSMNSMKMQKDMTLKDEPPRSVGVQYTIREEQRSSWRNN